MGYVNEENPTWTNTFNLANVQMLVCYHNWSYCILSSAHWSPLTLTVNNLPGSLSLRHDRQVEACLHRLLISMYRVKQMHSNGLFSAVNELNRHKLHYRPRWECKIHPHRGRGRKEEKGLTVASMAVRSGGVHTCTNKATYTHTNRVSVFGLRLLWMFSWEITLNKIRPEEFCVFVGVCVKQPNTLSLHYSPLLDQYVV